MDNLSSDDDFIADDIEDSDELIAEFGKELEEQNRIWKQKMCPYQNVLTERFHLSEDEAYHFLISVNRIAYEAEDFSDAFAYYLKEFGNAERLQKFVKRHSNIFTIKPYTIFGERIHYFECTFQITHEECISMLIRNPSWLYHKQEFFSNKIKELAELFDMSNEAAANLLLQYPFILNKLNKRALQERIQEVAYYFEVPKKMVTEFLLEYPHMINQNLSFYKWTKISKEIFDKHWLIETIRPYQRGCGFGGYRTFNNLMKVVGEIQKYFGEIIQHYKRVHGDDVFSPYRQKKIAITISLASVRMRLPVSNVLILSARSQKIKFWSKSLGSKSRQRKKSYYIGAKNMYAK